MPPLSGLRIAIAGGGVFGLSIAALCVRAGARVTLFEPRALGDNASGVAAGMLAPGFEALLEQPAGANHALFRRGYAAWTGFAAQAGVLAAPDAAAGALYVGSEDELATVGAELTGLDVHVERLSLSEARRRQPGLGDREPAALYVGQDGRLDPSATLHALQQRVEAQGGEVWQDALTPVMAPRFEAVVLAAGFESRAWREQAPELAWLEPIKGHVLHYRGGVTSGPVIRSRAGYAAPQSSGTVFGATMEAGRSNLELDAGVVQRLEADAAALLPSLAQTPFTPRTGIRAATPDGRPMVGRTGRGLYVATGARRNGWLLAPLVAEAMVRALQGARAEPDFDPGRFGHAPPTNA